MANVGFVPVRGTQEQIDETSIVDGQLLFNTETSGKNKGRMYLDVDSQRLDVGGDLSTELTQAEYDLLSEEEKKIGTYYITDAKGTSVGALKKKIGNTDISDIGDGTCTGAIDTLNDSLNNIGSITNALLSGTVTLENYSFTDLITLNKGTYILFVGYAVNSGNDKTEIYKKSPRTELFDLACGCNSAILVVEENNTTFQIYCNGSAASLWRFHASAIRIK